MKKYYSDDPNLEMLDKLYEENYKDLKSTTWPRIKVRVGNQNIKAHYLGCTKEGVLMFKCNSGTTPGKWWHQQVEFVNIEDAVRMLNMSLMLRKKKIIEMLINGDIKVNCLRRGTKVITSEGYEKNIEDIKVGDYVLTHKGRYRKVVRTYVNKAEEMIKIETPGHIHDLIITPNHEILTYKGVSQYYMRKKGIEKYIEPRWIASGLLKEGDYVLLPSNSEGTRRFSDEKAWLIGAYLGDGCIKVRKTISDGIHYYLSYTLDTDEERLLKNYIYSIEKETGNSPRVYNSVNNKTGSSWKTVTIHRGTLGSEIFNLCGKNLENKHLPERYLELTRRERLMILAGLWATDGSVFQNGKMKWSSASYSLFCQVKTLVSSLGIYYGEFIDATRSNDKEYGSYSKGKLYSIQTSYTDAKELLDILVEMGTCKYIPKDEGHKRYPLNKCGWSLYKIKKISRFTTDEEVYNLEVEDDNSYIANGITVHNCDDPSWHYYFKYTAWKGGYGIVREVRPSLIRNPKQDKSMCKHLYAVLLLLPNISDKILADYKKKKVLPSFLSRVKSRVSRRT